MESTAPTRSPIWSWLFVLLAAVHLADFIWYGNTIRDLLGAAGFGVMAFASFRNAPTSLKGIDSKNVYHYWLSIVGLLLVLTSIALKYVFHA